MNKSFNLLLIVLLVFLTGFFLEETIDSSKLSNYKSLEETFEIISELFSVFVALSIFSITWHAYDKSRDNHSLFLGTTFLITGLLTLCHLLSYPFMPDFITPNSLHKSGIFFLESRFILAFLLLASVYVNKDSFPKLINKYVMVLFTAAILSVSLTSVWFHTDFLFVIFNLDNYSTETVFLLFLITIIILVTGYLYYKKAKETFQTNLNYLANGSIIVLVSNLVYFSYEFSAHFLIITGFVYFYLGLYKTSVELPYEKLAISEEKLRRAAQEKYRCLFDNANDAIVTINMGGLVTSWNKSAEKLFGWTVVEITGKMLFETIGTHETVAMNEKMINNLLSDTVTGQEMVCIRRDGTKIDVSVTISPLMDESLNFAESSLIIRDITEQKRSEDKLRKSKESFSKAEKIGHFGYWEWDLATNKLVWSDEVFRLYGIDPQKVVPTYETVLCTLSADTREWFIKAIGDAINNNDPFEGEYSLIRPDGNVRCTHTIGEVIRDCDGKAISMFGVIQDITERKKTEEELLKFKLGIERSDEVIFITNIDGSIIYMNPAFEKIYGYSREETLGKTPRILKSGLFPSEVYKSFWDTLLVKKVVNGEMVNKTKDGRLLNIDGSANPILNDNGNIIGFLAIQRDITERKLTQEKIARSLEEKKVLLREIHHRVKNNMQIVSSLLMLQSQNIEDKKYKDMFIESQTRIYSMALIHEKLYQSESIAHINFKEYIDGIVSNIFESYCIKSNIKIDINVENIPIKIDYAIPCGLIINEIVTNSLKYAFPDGRQGKIQISLKSYNNNMIQLSISDDGIGIAKDMDIRNTKSLGLHLVTALAEGQLHGKIILNREKGTEFQIGFGVK